MKYEDIVIQFESENEKSCDATKQRINSNLKISNSEAVADYVMSCVKSDIEHGYLPCEDGQDMSRSLLMYAIRFIADLLAKEYESNGANIISAMPKIVADTFETIFPRIDRSVVNISKVIKVFSSQASLLLPSYLIRRTIQSKKARAYCITNQLTQSLERTRLKGLTAEDILLPEPLTVIHLMGKPDAIVVFLQVAVEPPNKKLLYVVTYFPKGSIKASEAVYTFSSYNIGTALQLFDPYEGDLSKDPNTSNIINETVRISINALLYIINNPEDACQIDSSKEIEDLKARMLKAQGAKREKLKERLRSMPKTPIQLVGRHYVIDKKLQRDPTVSGEADYHLRVRFIVAGHWRKQACGPGLTERRLMWIQPYWKGPEFAPITRSIGIVK